MATAFQCSQSPVATPTRDGVNIVFWTYVLTAALVIGDSIVGPEIPPGAELYDFYVDMPRADTDASPTLTWDIGTDLATNAGGVGDNGFFDTAIVGRGTLINEVHRGFALQNTTIDTTFVHGSLPFLYVPVEPAAAGILPPKCHFQLLVEAAPATGATTGTFYGWLAYTMLNTSPPTVAGSFR